MSNVEMPPAALLACLGLGLAAGCRSVGEPTPSPAPSSSPSPVASWTESAIRVMKKPAPDEAGAVGGAARTHTIKTVFVIVMENSNWSRIYQSPDAPYINSLLPKASFCSHYFDNPLGVHPSEPNYVWLEAGFHLGLTTDADPSGNNLASADHLTRQMDAAGIPWKTYAEDMTVGTCPIASQGLYAPKHVPALFFADIVGNPPTASSPQCIRHVVPFAHLARDLKNGAVPRYAFVVPNLCNDMHGAPDCPPGSNITAGDDWLARTVPTILQSQAYADGGALFITWDESERGEHPIGMIVLSPAAKGGGYQSDTKYFHSSFLRTVQEVFDLSPLLNDAANRPDLADLFRSFP